MFKAREATLRQLFENGEYDQFIIPHYQRSYVWGIDELENFWNDFIVRSDVGSLHLLGSIIISKSKTHPRAYGVVDGQQRLITCSLFIAALRDYWGEKYGFADSDYYNLERFIVKADRTQGTILKVNVSATLKDTYDAIVVAKSIGQAPAKSDDQKNLLKAYNFFYSKINEVYSANRAQEKAKQDLLWKKIDNLFDSNLVLVALEEEDDAYEVFEGFNARGVELSIADLFKNLFLQKIKGDDIAKQQALDKWNEINQVIIDSRISRFNINTFLRYYWIRNNTFIGERQLYKRIKKDTANYQALLSDIHTLACDLRVLFNGSPYDIKELFSECHIKYANSIHSSLNALKVINTQSYIVWLMTLVDRKVNQSVSPKLIARSLRQVEVFSFRYFTVSKLPSNRIEKLYAKLSKELFVLAERDDSQRISSLITDSLTRKIAEDKLLPETEQFLADFDNIYLQTNNKALIRYILSQIEQAKSSGEKIIDQQTVNIEHILPQKPGKEWGISAQDHKANFNRLGNLTILLEALNSSMSNKPISEKMEFFKQSDLDINKQVVEMVSEAGNWTALQIGHRQKILAEEAEKIWKL